MLLIASQDIEAFMGEILTGLFDTSGFPARWQCGAWSDELGWLHIGSDLAIWAAYTAIPCVLAFFILRRQDVPFPRILWLFVAFIFACGTTHLISAIIFWQPVYRLDGVVKFLTAVVSWGTVVALVQITPKALHLPGLERVNAQLAHEVAERKRSEELLRVEEERLRLALIAGRMGTWSWEIATNRVTWSAEIESIHGIAAGSFAGTFAAFIAMVHPDDRARMEQIVQRNLEQLSNHHSEYRIITADGRTRWVEARGTLFTDEQGRPQLMSGVSMDVTARKEAEEERERLLDSERYARSEAEKANRLKDEFLSLVSHELRTPLNAMLGYAQLLLMNQRTPQQVTEAATVIERNGRAQVQIIDDLLDMSRVITGKMRLDVQSVDLCDVVRRAIDTITPRAAARGIEVQAVLDPRAGQIAGDASRLEQIFLNLLSNAVKFTPKQGRVQVTLARVNSHVEVQIADTGQGIEGELLPFVFDRFRQGDGSTQRRHGGLGLGLSLVKHLVEMHGGSVRASSDGRGKGSLFTVVLPLQISAPDAGTDRVQPVAAASMLRSHGAPPIADLRVLIVDDEADARGLAARILEQHGVEVHSAATADEALELLRRVRPDVIVSDIGMPGTDGYQLMRMVRALPDEEGGRTPAVAATAFARGEDRTKALLSGYQAHLAKPVDANELVAAVATLAGRTGRGA
ncbi:hybrid sensor histidine kinase/response regulator [Lacipirellula limnantheis]|uniref:hybrid sensor histidine kinase/response regulator n=1 Tax=Lacipirellula limnantheis TaxID=2528024 RepID=UPI00143D6B5C|nr:PAS domain-containing hybrid sensor histidine kinase/response regulator [Lacipirellula limnantheis]